jgi:hypothetical protein
MNRSLSEVLNILSSWESNSLSVKAALFVGRGRVVVQRGAITVKGSTVEIRDSSGTELRLSLSEATILDFKDSVDLPEDVREEAMARTLSSFFFRFPDGMTLILLELWAHDAQDIPSLS